MYVKHLWNGLLCYSVIVLFAATGAAQTALSSNVITSLVELQSVVREQGRAIRSFRLEGVVCAIACDRSLLAIQDSSATILLEVPALDNSVQKIGRASCRE